VRKNYPSWLFWLIVPAVPVALVLTAVRLLITPVFIQIEYNTPGFPQDPYGFTKEERIYWANIAANYLVNNADISFLADLHFPKGQSTPPATCRYMDDCTKLYNERELKHMLDVKNVLQAALWVWYISLGILLLTGLLAYLDKWWRIYRRAIRLGGWFTVLLLGAILIFVFLAFGFIFVIFHEIFFASGTWTFLFSDTLIRLFPERFWRDTFLAVGLLSGGAGLTLGLLLKDKEIKDGDPPVDQQAAIS
jgi:integral membrane protein (TIGR01906 family)